SQLLEFLQECCIDGFGLSIIRCPRCDQPPDPLDCIGPLRACHDRPSCRRAAEEREEGAAVHQVPDHSITSSVRASSVGGTSRPSAFAVLRLMTNSNWVGCITGKSAGFWPLSIR